MLSWIKGSPMSLLISSKACSLCLRFVLFSTHAHRYKFIYSFISVTLVRSTNTNICKWTECVERCPVNYQYVTGSKRNQIMSRNQHLPEIPDTQTEKMSTTVNQPEDAEVGGTTVIHILMRTRSPRSPQDTRMKRSQRRGKERKRKVSVS